GQVGLAVGQPADLAGAGAGRHLRVDRVDVEAHVDVVGPAHDDLDRLLDDRRHAAPVDVLHGEGVDPRVAQVAPLDLVEVAQADLDHLRRVELGARVADPGQLRRALAQEAGHGHAVDVARGRGLGRVDVAVRVEPDHAQAPGRAR